MNPVVLLDEVDKVGSDYRGDPAAALLEVLDPAQNHTFRDHYLEVDLDLSDVLFLATANVADTIPDALLDRMEVVTLDGYTEDEKVAIARTHLLPRQLERAALAEDEVSLADEALRLVAGQYTREAGVRQLERAVAKVLRKVATRLAVGATATSVAVDEDNLRELPRAGRGSPRSRRSARRCRAWRPGWPSPAPAATCCSSRRPRWTASAALTLTGQLGDVMKESAQIALSYLRAHGAEHGVDAIGARPGPAPARARGRGAQGRAVGRRHHGDRAGVAGDRATGARRRRDDRRGHPERPGAADRRREAEAARRPAGRAADGVHPAAQRARPRRRAGRGAGGARRAAGRRRGRDPRAAPWSRPRGVGSAVDGGVGCRGCVIGRRSVTDSDEPPPPSTTSTPTSTCPAAPACCCRPTAPGW